MNKSSLIFEKLSNESRNIFGIIQKNGPVTKNQLLLFANMKLTTLNRIMEPLEDLKMIVEADVGESTGGRRPVLYDVNPGMYYAVGIDISRTYTKVVLNNLKMELISQQEFLMDESCRPQKTIELISDAVQIMLENLSIDKTCVLGAGIGTVGPLDRKEGVVINPRNFEAPGWVDVPLKKMLERELEIPVIIDNGANTAVLVEYLYGDGREFENIGYFNCGVGIRTGVISSGNIVRTINDAEDAFGHMVIDVNGEKCSCGSYGCIECYSSINSIVKKFADCLKRGRTTVIAKAIEEINYIDICKAAEDGDEVAREVIKDGAVIFGSGLANYISLLNPKIIILSGPLIRHSELFFNVCKDVALRKHYLRGQSKIVFNRGGHFKENAMAVGASAMLVEWWLEK